MGLNASVQAENTGSDEWSRVGEYLDRLAFENDRLEAELKLKKQRRLDREAATTPQPALAGAQEARFDERGATHDYESRAATETTTGMHLSYDALRSDLSGLMSDLNEFKSTRAGLESRLSL